MIISFMRKTLIFTYHRGYHHVVKIVASNGLPIKASISKCQQIPSLTYFTQSEVETRADTRLLYNLLRMECITAYKGYGINIMFMKIHFHVEAEICLNP